MLNLEEVKRGNPLAATVQRLTGQEIVRHKICSPWRNERTPSLHIYEDGRWKDYGTGESGDVLDFVGKFYFGNGYNPHIHLKEVVDRLGGLGIQPLPAAMPVERIPKEKPKLNIDPSAIRAWHETMPPARREYWYGRGLCDPVIDQFQLGWDGKRYTIPATYRGVPFAVKRRRSEIDDGIDAKYISIKGSRGGIFNIDATLTERKLVLCEGEIDAMLLVQAEIPAVSVTVGAGGWRHEWTRFFMGIDVTILYDNDAAGQRGWHLVWRSMRRAQRVRLPDGIKDVGELFENYPFPLTWLKENLP